MIATLLLAIAAGQDPTALSVQAAGTRDEDAGKPAKIVGPEAAVQLVVTATMPDGKPADWSGRAQYGASPEGIVRVDANGLVTPLKDGTATVRAAAANGPAATVEITVERFDPAPSVNFANQITPIFTKLGCNSGGCHGKSGGQNGFRLSLLGFEPQEDYQYLVQESFGRRIFPTAPEHSLMLLKATATLPHGGGDRLRKESPDYRLILRWLAQGMPYGDAKDPTVASIAVFPRHRVLGSDAAQQIKVVATYTDGSTQDVTRTARYEPVDKMMAEVDEGGRVRMLGRPGEAGVMVRYQERVAVFEATVPLGAPVAELPPARNFVDEHVFAKLRQLGLPPSPVCDDATFLRRVTLDVTGRLPTAEEARAFLADPAPDKRDKWIDRLLESDAYADAFANKWSAILRNKRVRETFRNGNFAFHQWVRESLKNNKPYDKFVREILTASGEVSANPPVSWYRQVTQINEQVEDVAQLFLGVRIQCARCHHHPFEKWSGQDYYGLAAFFSTIGRKEGLAPDEQRIFAKRGAAQATHPKSGKNVGTIPLGSEPVSLTVDDDPRIALADWMARPDNPFFARSLVNRYWKHFFGRGIVEPEDDMRETNPPTHKQLLDALSRRFVESGFDLKDLVRTLCRSSAYQLSSMPNEHNGADRQSFSRFLPRRLAAETLLDAIDQVNGTASSFGGLPPGTRAVEIPDHGGVSSYFLTVFGRPAGSSACECERTLDASLAQSLHLLNSDEIHGKVAGGVAAALAGDAAKSEDDKIAELYLRAFSRPPTEEERKVAAAHLAKFEAKDKKNGYEDIVWALINTKEFLFNH